MKNIQKRVERMTPKEAWNEFIGHSVEMFISLFHLNTPPVYDTEEMMRIIAKETCDGFRKPYTVKTRDCIERKLRDYINEYIDKQGGLDKLNLYTEKEVDAIEDKMTEEVLSMLRALRGIKNPLK